MHVETVNLWCFMFQTLVQGYITYGNGEFDGQDSGHDFYGTLYTPPIGWRNNTDGGRSILFPDYRQA